MKCFHHGRLKIARMRRGLSSKELAQLSGLTPVTITRLEKAENEPDESTIRLLSQALSYPESFFFGDDIDYLPKEAASFRSLTSLTAKQKNAALAAGSLAYLLSDWIEQLFDLPEPDLPDLSFEDNERSAARLLREHWGLGDRPISHMIKLLESKGVRVFSLIEDTKNVDAFSCWRGDKPYIFLNTMKSAERSRLDAAHELAHLVLHKHGAPQGREAEHEANGFAGEFLIPEGDLRQHAFGLCSLGKLIAIKKRWGVSVAALVVQMRKAGLIGDHHYRMLFIELSTKGYRVNEPEPMERETSIVMRKILEELWKEKRTKAHIAEELCIPFDELENLLGLINPKSQSDNINKGNSPKLISN